MKNNPFPIKQCDALELSFDEQGSAYSNNYGDIYFQPGIGLDEKNHVFLKGNHLPENWSNKSLFTIGETGFGTGLNFLNTLKSWNQTISQTDNNKQLLHYISCEQHPMNKQQLQQALSTFPELDIYSKQLINRYPQFLLYGLHRLHFKQYNTTLTLIFGDCVDAFNNIDASIDAWFLDGFAPSKNSDMWSDQLFKAIADKSHLSTTVATYTVARKIRESLQAVGFEITKTKGFGQKREMLTAKLMTDDKTMDKQPWFYTFKSSKQETFTIIGAGIAGLSIAQKLQAQGKKVTLIDRQKQPCLETSGNPQAMVMPSFDINDSPEARFYLTAFLYAIQYYSTEFYHPVGVHELAFTDKQIQWQKRFLQQFNLPNDLIQHYKNGLLYPQAGWLDTQGHANTIFQQLDNYQQDEITSIKYIDGIWHLYEDSLLVHSTETLVLANGINIKRLMPDYEWPIVPKHGEISYFNSSDMHNTIANNPHIQLCKGYITPSWNGVQTMGATFEHLPENHWFESPQTSVQHWQKNTELWNNTPYAELLKQDVSVQSRAGLRVTTPDHLPICGGLINQQLFKKDYHDIRHGKHWKQYPTPQTIDNLYVLTGLGSRGFTSAPILAEFLVNQMLGQPQVLNKRMQKSIHPNRFLFKSLKKK